MQQKKLNNKKPFDGIVRKQTKVVVEQSKKSFRETLVFSAMKTIAVLLLVLSISFGLSKTGGTISYFNDIESSIGNYMRAGTLGFSLSADEDIQGLVAKVEEENIGSEQFNVTVTQDPDSLPIIYTVEGKLDDGTPIECQQVNLVADMGDYHYDNYEFVFVSPKMTDLGEWQFMVSIPVSSSVPAGAVCSGSIVFKAGLAGVSDDLANTYTDVKIYTFKLKNWEGVETTLESLVAEEIVEPPQDETTPLVLEPPQVLEETTEETTEEATTTLETLPPDITPEQEVETPSETPPADIPTETPPPTE